MGDLRLNDISYSGNGTGVLMLNGVNYTGGQGGGGSVTPDYCDFCNEYIELPFTPNANHKVFVDYELPMYINQLQILGNTRGTPSSFYHGIYNNNLYVYTNNGEIHFSNSTWGGRHVLIVNDSGRVTYDEVDKSAGTPNTDTQAHYTIGYRGSGVQLTGRVYRFYIYDTVNDEYICDLMPTWDNVNSRTALKDIINNVVYTPSKWT